MFLWNAIWQWPGPQRKAFLWLMNNDKLLTNDQRSRRKLSMEANCTLCLSEFESTIHVLRDKFLWKKNSGINSSM